MAYVVRVIGPSGMETYLKSGREVHNPDSATRYPNPSSAHRAREGFVRKTKARLYVSVQDPDDPERGDIA